MSAEFAVIVCFAVKPETRAQFMTLVRDNARQSVTLERDCTRFDIVEPPGQPDHVWLYEIYSSRAAFDVHLTAPHFLSFDAATREMITGKTVVTGRLTEAIKG